MQLFHLIFTQPGAHLLEIPCTLSTLYPILFGLPSSVLADSFSFLNLSALLPSFYSFSEPDIGKEGGAPLLFLSARASH